MYKDIDIFLKIKISLFFDFFLQNIKMVRFKEILLDFLQIYYTLPLLAFNFFYETDIIFLKYSFLNVPFIL